MRRHPRRLATLTCVGIVLLASTAAASGQGAVGFVVAALVAGLQALLAMMVCEVGLSLWLVARDRRRGLAWLYAAALVASVLCLRWPWLGPSVVVAPFAVALWPSRRTVALAALAIAALLGAVGALWSTASIVLVVGAAVPFLPIGVALHREGRPRAALASMLALGLGLVAMLRLLGTTTSAVWPLVAFAFAAAPLALFLARGGRRAAGLAVLVATPALLSLLGLVRWG